jgi:hypothetical protein
VSELCDQLTDQIKSSRFALQVAQADYAFKNALLTTYFLYALESDIWRISFVVRHLQCSI